MTDEGDQPIDYKSDLEAQFGRLWESEYPEIDLHHQCRGIPGRQFQFDFAHIPSKTAIEINGGIWMPASGHNTGQGLEDDYKKALVAAANGWAVIPLSGKMITHENLEMIREAISIRSRPR